MEYCNSQDICYRTIYIYNDLEISIPSLKYVYIYACLNFQENPNGKLSILVVMLLGTKLDSNQYLLPRSNITYLKILDQKSIFRNVVLDDGVKNRLSFSQKTIIQELITIILFLSFPCKDFKSYFYL